MANKKTVALTKEQYTELITTIREGGAGFRSNERIAAALTLEANLGLRIEDVLEMHLTDVIRDGNRYRLDITEQKTGKKRCFTVPQQIYQYMQLYCFQNGIAPEQKIFPVTERAVQKHLAKVVEYLGYKEPISTHSFRKFFATEIYLNNGYNILLVQQLLQHSSAAITQRYIGITSEEMETALSNHVCIV